MTFSLDNTQVLAVESDTAMLRNAMKRDMRPSGEECDRCKTRTELQVHHLNACASCEKAFYCSRECQRKQWKAGHSDHCRKPGEFRPRDYARVLGLRSRAELNHKPVQVIGPDPEFEGQLQVRIKAGTREQVGTVVSVAVNKLERFRPLL